MHLWLLQHPTVSELSVAKQQQNKNTNVLDSSPVQVHFWLLKHPADSELTVAEQLQLNKNTYV